MRFCTLPRAEGAGRPKMAICKRYQAEPDRQSPRGARHPRLEKINLAQQESTKLDLHGSGSCSRNKRGFHAGLWGPIVRVMFVNECHHPQPQ